MGSLKALSRYLPPLTWKRIANALLLYGSFWLSRILRTPIHWGHPMALSIEPGSVCNLKCPECPTGAGSINRPRGMNPGTWHKQVIRQSAKHLLVINFYLQGEPFMHPQLFEMISAASSQNTYTITSTNGQIFNKELAIKTIQSGLSEIVFSMDGLTQGTFEKYRQGGQLQAVTDAISLLAQTKQEMNKTTPHIVAQFLVFKHNEHEAQDFKETALKLGANEAIVKQAQFNEFGQNQVFPPDTLKYKRKLYNEKGQAKSNSYRHCWKQWSSAVITWDGQVLPCCFDKDADFPLGNVTSTSLKDIWKGSKTNDFRSKILTSKNYIQMCQNCPYGRSFFS